MGAVVHFNTYQPQWQNLDYVVRVFVDEVDVFVGDIEARTTPPKGLVVDGRGACPLGAVNLMLGFQKDLFDAVVNAAVRQGIVLIETRHTVTGPQRCAVLLRRP